jgi:hypothetical protein
VSTVERASLAGRSGGEAGNAEPSPPHHRVSSTQPASVNGYVILRRLEGEMDRTWPDVANAIGVYAALGNPLDLLHLIA